ncbi:Splicing factor [Coemansia sp. RSA 1200]|nr:Splicing factor [Coemansia sp. RSA 1200]
MSAELDALNSLEEFMSELPEKLEKTPYDYGTYIRWIELLRTIGDIESMRAARKAMSLRLAVPEDVWTEWIEDEKHQNTGGISDAASISQIKELFDAATREYVSPSMWQKYIDFAKELSNSEAGSVHAAAGKVFSHDDPTLIVLEQAVSAAHALYCGGQEIWLQYMNQLKDRIDRAADIESNQNELVDKLQSVFLERLDQPHAEIEETFNLYSEFVTKYFADSAYESLMVNASGVVGNTRVRCSRREALEESVVTSEGSWYTFSQYIDTISRGKQLDIREVSCLYERALLHNYCYPQVWDEYIAFAACSSDEPGDAVNVAGRAVRNCPWSGKLWAQLLSLTYISHGYQSATSIYDNAVSTHALDHSMHEFSYIATSLVSAARLEYQASESKDSDAGLLLDTCSSCIEATYKLDISTADPDLHLERCCSSIITTFLENNTAARELWIRICKARGSCSEAWVLSAEFERTHGTILNARNVYRHAAQRKLDYPERLYSAWLVFEHVFGDQLTALGAERFINIQRHFTQRRAERSIITDNDKYSGAPLGDDGKMTASGASLKRTRSGTIQYPSAYTANAASGNIGLAVSHGGNETALSTTDISATSHTTVFISNLPVSYRETHVTELLGGIECVDKVELLSNKDGSFRGQAKACLRSTGALISALDKNGFRLENQHISIHIFKKHHQSARHEISVEVKGFSQETGNKKIEEIAKKAGGFIRIRRNKQGTIAYVVMKSMDAAVRAASALNGCEIDEHTLEAGISSADPTVEGVQEHCGIVPEAPSTSLIPRKVATPLRRPAKKLKIEKQDAADRSGLTMERGDVSNKSSSKKSNDQFRQMYLNPNSKV